MERSFEDTLIEALDALDAGEPVEVIVHRYPAEEARLRPMLITARAARKLRLEPSPSTQARSRAAFLAQAAEKRAEIAAAPARRPLIRLPLIQMMTIFLVVISLGAMVVFTAQGAMPDNPLYTIKRGMETVRLTLASGSNRDALEARFNEERLREVRVMLNNGHDAEVQFTGRIDAMAGETWQIAGIAVQVDKSTQVRGIASVGQIATVSGNTYDGILSAIRIEISGTFDITPDPDKVLPTPTTPIKDPAPTHDAANTPAPNQPRATPTTIFSPATQTPPPSDDDNENENENENDNGGGSGSNSGSGGGGDDNENENDNDD